MSDFGHFSKSLISPTPADLQSPVAIQLKQHTKRFLGEAVYIYSFKENKMIYADGWHEILGYPDDEINMVTIVDITAPEFKPFSFELNDKALAYILTKTEELEQYSFTIELKKIHKAGHAIPIIARVGVYSSENGRVTEIIGRNQVNHSIKFGRVMRYAAFGPNTEGFEEELNKQLFKHFAISQKEKEAVAMLANGHTFKEIAAILKVSQSAIEKRVLPLYKRFDVQSLPHLISFAYENHILP